MSSRGLQKFLKDAIKEINVFVRPMQTKQAVMVFEEQIKFIITSVRDHPVSQELMHHTDPSALLGGARGTLFGFMGFRAGATPVEDLLLYLRSNIKPKIRRTLRGVTLSVRLPTFKELRKVEHMVLPYEGGYSWVEAVEKGLSGLPFYKGTKGGNISRSKEGVQVRTPLRGGEFKTMPFLTEIFENAQKQRIKL